MVEGISLAALGDEILSELEGAVEEVYVVIAAGPQERHEGGIELALTPGDAIKIGADDVCDHCALVSFARLGHRTP